MCVVRVMKALRTPGICGKGVMVEDFSQIIPTRIPHPRGLFYFNTNYYVCIIYTFMDKQNKVQSMVTSAVQLSCKAVLHVLTY